MRKIDVALVCAGLLFVSSHARAQETYDFPHTRTVYELLDIDAQKALSKESPAGDTSSEIAALRQELQEMRDRTKPAPEAQAEEPAAPSVKKGIVVDSIYGVGNQLTANVTIDGQMLHFKQGQQKALNNPSSAYRLSRIDPPCVVLRNGSDSPQRSCYVME
jgi:hypothetical protein